METKDVARFWGKVEARGPDECWPWKGGTFANGYGAFSLGGNNVQSHRVACELAHGPAPADKPLALHARHCTSRACCNPAHLRWGKQAWNMLDRTACGRHAGGPIKRAQ